MNLIHIDDIDQSYNYAILRNDRQDFLNRNYILPFNILNDLEIISGMSYDLLDSIDYKIECLIKYIDSYIKGVDSKKIAFEMIFNFFENCNIYAIKEGIIESIINTLNKSSYAFYPCNCFSEFIKNNNISFNLKNENIELLICDNTNVNEIIVKLYKKFKDKKYKYLDEFIIYTKYRFNQTIMKRK